MTGCIRTEQTVGVTVGWILIYKYFNRKSRIIDKMRIYMCENVYRYEDNIILFS